MTMPTTTIPAKDLRAGHRFKWSLGQRQFRTVKSATAVKAADYPSVLEVDSMIIVLDDCRQVTFPMDHTVWVETTSTGAIKTRMDHMAVTLRCVTVSVQTSTKDLQKTHDAFSRSLVQYRIEQQAGVQQRKAQLTQHLRRFSRKKRKQKRARMIAAGWYMTIDDLVEKENRGAFLQSLHDML